jgi:hypothetical protein
MDLMTAGELRLMLIVTPTDVPHLVREKPSHVLYLSPSHNEGQQHVEFDLTGIYEGLGRHRLTLVGFRWVDR